MCCLHTVFKKEPVVVVTFPWFSCLGGILQAGRECKGNLQGSCAQYTGTEDKILCKSLNSPNDTSGKKTHNAD